MRTFFLWMMVLGAVIGGLWLMVFVSNNAELFVSAPTPATVVEQIQTENKCTGNIFNLTCVTTRTKIA